MEWELCFIRKIECMRVNGTMTQEMVKDMRDTLIIINTRENLCKEKLMEKVYIPGQMERSMTENGKEG